MDSLDFTEDEIREQLSILGYRNIPTHRLREFKQDLDELIRHGEWRGVAPNATGSPTAGPSKPSPPAVIKEKVSQTRGYDSGPGFFLHAGDRNRDVLAEPGRRLGRCDSYAQHSVAPKLQLPPGAPSMLQVETDPDDTLPSLLTDSHTSTPDTRGRRFLRRKVLRKHEGQSLVCDESVYSEDSGEHSSEGLHNMYGGDGDDENDSLNSSFWSDGESEEEEDEEKVERATGEEGSKPGEVGVSDQEEMPEVMKRSMSRESSEDADEENGSSGGESPALSPMTSGYGTYRAEELDGGGDHGKDLDVTESDQDSRGDLSETGDEGEGDRSFCSFGGFDVGPAEQEHWETPGASPGAESNDDDITDARPNEEEVDHGASESAEEDRSLLDEKTPAGGGRRCERKEEEMKEPEGETESEKEDGVELGSRGVLADKVESENKAESEDEVESGDKVESDKKVELGGRVELGVRVELGDKVESDDGVESGHKVESEFGVEDRTDMDDKAESKYEVEDRVEESEDADECRSNKDIKFTDCEADLGWTACDRKWEGNLRRRKTDLASSLDDRLSELHVSPPARREFEAADDDAMSRSDAPSSGTEGTFAGDFEFPFAGMARAQRDKPKSFIRPVMHATKKTDPVTKYYQYKRFWEMFKLPGEKERKDLRLEIKERLEYQPPLPKPRRVFVPNTYVVPTEKKRSELRWQIRNDLANGLVPYKFSYLL